MKSKIDEVILLLSDLSNCITIIAEEQANYLGISQVIVDKLEQLRPYVLISELLVSDRLKVNSDLSAIYAQDINVIPEIQLLIQQIKEQKDEI